MPTRRRSLAALLFIAVTGLGPPALAQLDAPVPPLPRLDFDGDSLPWAITGEWQVENASYGGNPYDVVATVTFSHESGESISTEMFHAGDDRWRFRFTGTRLGVWRFSSSSDDPELNGHSGSVTIVPADPKVQGFLEAHGNKLVVSVDNGERLLGVAYNVFVTSQEDFQSVSDLPSSSDELNGRVDALLDDTEANGFNSFFVPVNNSWFAFGTRGHDEHDSADPDPVTFAVLETLIREAHRRGMFIHLWAWGDERRRWTPRGVPGGINGEADRRLQRHIAARLGPLPGWTMSYGFDLEEWVEPEEVISWASFLHERSGWPPLLMAREYGQYEGYEFTLDGERLDVFSTDDRPEGDFYELAVSRLEKGRPVLFERRFVYRRDGIWDADTTRRAMWQFAMAGGAGSIWGLMFDDPTPYPNREEFRIHREFWKERLHPESRPVAASGETAYALSTPDARHWVFYQEDSDRVALQLSEMPEPRRAVAVDARGDSYQEIDLGELGPGEQVWQAPHRSDWAVAVGFGD